MALVRQVHARITARPGQASLWPEMRLEQIRIEIDTYTIEEVLDRLQGLRSRCYINTLKVLQNHYKFASPTSCMTFVVLRHSS